MAKETKKNRRSFQEAKLIEYLAVPAKGKKCYCSCNHCYLLHSQTDRVERSEEKILEDIGSLARAGYKVFFCTTELFLFDKWQEIFRIAGYKSIRTNGYPFVNNPSLVDTIVQMGITKVTFTANAGRYHGGLNLPEEKVVKKAIEMSRDRGLVTSVNVLLNKNNYQDLEEMTQQYMDLGVDYFIFSRILPANGLDNCVYPCSFMTQKEYKLGRLENGKIHLDRTFDLKLTDPFGCFAHDVKTI